MNQAITSLGSYVCRESFGRGSIARRAPGRLPSRFSIFPISGHHRPNRQRRGWISHQRVMRLESVQSEPDLLIAGGQRQIRLAGEELRRRLLRTVLDDIRNDALAVNRGTGGGEVARRGELHSSAMG